MFSRAECRTPRARPRRSGLLDRVDAEVGLEIELEIEHGADSPSSETIRSTFCVIPCAGVDEAGVEAALEDDPACALWARLLRAFGARSADDRARTGMTWLIVGKSLLEILLLRNRVRLAHRREGLGLLHGIDAKVRLEIEIEVQHVGRIARLFGIRSGGPLPSPRRLGADVGAAVVQPDPQIRGCGGCGAEAATIAALAARSGRRSSTNRNDVLHGREVAKLEVRVAEYQPSHRGETSPLKFHGDAEVGPARSSSRSSISGG